MNYEKCWEMLKDKLLNKLQEAKAIKDGWTIVLTAKIILEMMKDIEREVRDNEL